MPVMHMGYVMHGCASQASIEMQGFGKVGEVPESLVVEVDPDTQLPHPSPTRILTPI